jgi:hypothetical protein
MDPCAQRARFPTSSDVVKAEAGIVRNTLVTACSIVHAVPIHVRELFSLFIETGLITVHVGLPWRPLTFQGRNTAKTIRVDGTRFLACVGRCDLRDREVEGGISISDGNSRGAIDWVAAGTTDKSTVGRDAILLPHLT